MIEAVKSKRGVTAAVVLAIVVLVLLFFHGHERFYQLSSCPPSTNLDSSSRASTSLSERRSSDLRLGQILQKVKYTSEGVDLLNDHLRDFIDRMDMTMRATPPPAVVAATKPVVADEDSIVDLSLDLDEVKAVDPVPEAEKHDKWIVVTSIFSPTEDMKKLAKIPGWKMVVVGDFKTPNDWALDGVVFLSIDTQESSRFETVKHLKRGVYQRKNMGYLYAIQHGAKYIYDTDDDNHPYGGKVDFDDLTTDKQYLVYNEERNYYNTFAHFGQSTIWPRGYPLNHIAKTVVRTYKKCKKVRPLVQQGVVDGDPDLDAVQRLTRKDLDVKFDVLFDRTAPPVILPKNSFAPYNSQNTIHHYDAFFALLLPQTVTFRVNDIWRSYIAQRLMWDIGGHLAYYPPSAYQDRTPHDFLQDFIEEDDLYKKCLPLTKFLLTWKGNSKLMHERFFELIKELYKLEILGSLDVKLARAWIRDMVSIDYKFPALRESPMQCGDEVVDFFPKEKGSMYLRAGKQVVNIFEAMTKSSKSKSTKKSTRNPRVKTDSSNNTGDSL